MNTSDLVREHFYRRQAKRLNLELQKSRGKKWSVRNRLGYRIIDATGDILAGYNYELSINQAASFLENYEKKLKEA
jgi:hypothetical protein